MFRIDIVTPEGRYHEVDVESITLPTPDGQRTVLHGHMGIVLPVDIGVMYTKSKEGQIYYAISEGLFTFENNHAKLLVETIEREDEIDFQRAENARARALKRLEEKKEYDDEMDLKMAELSLKRSLSRLRLKK